MGVAVERTAKRTSDHGKRTDNAIHNLGRLYVLPNPKSVTCCAWLRPEDFEHCKHNEHHLQQALSSFIIDEETVELAYECLNRALACANGEAVEKARDEC